MMNGLYQHWAALLLYPHADLRRSIDCVRTALAEVSTDADASAGLFADAVAALSDDAWEELYTRTFDIAAQCPLYLGIHLFGPENHKRPLLMTGLCDAYSRAGINAAVELPDHLAVVLANQHAFEREEWDDLVGLCVLPAIEKMVGDLNRGNNPYQYLLAALHHVLKLNQGALLHV
jgi:nitrate reductase assembly molybdenum cofactor insertion protein NarJ